MHNENDTLGQIIKEARTNARLTRDDFSERTGLSVRYIASIENEGKKPSFNILYKIIRVLGIDANSIFYPEKFTGTDEKDRLIHKIDLCNENSLKIVSAVVNAVMENQ